jgi:dTDP-4-amino-4,6-dideoxy-D-glucose acyltransferase
LHAQSDDFKGNFLTNPTIPDKYRKIKKKKIILEKHALIGSGCRIMPGVVVAEGSAVGAMSLLVKDTKPWKVYFGIPAKPLRDRSKQLLELEKQLLTDN